jgi:hypothetical protein
MMIVLWPSQEELTTFARALPCCTCLIEFTTLKILAQPCIVLTMLSNPACIHALYYQRKSSTPENQFNHTPSEDIATEVGHSSHRA